ncbi:MAG: metallophosphoesterase family protein [Candidatus Hydrogenedentes bacterium]|nr:metallophosphoesterase family protein [Candidatus Hydrogenedentota bacterium]
MKTTPKKQTTRISGGPGVDALAARLGPVNLRSRLYLEANHGGQVFGPGRNSFHIENVEWLNTVIRCVFKATGLYNRGYRNYTDIRIMENTVELEGLPSVFDGFRLLHLSDLHADLDAALVDAVIERVSSLEYDACVITGDFRIDTTGSSDAAVGEVLRLIPHLKPPKFAVLGNHDSIAIVPPLEGAGLRFLLNESVPLARDGACIYLAGIDDPHLYETENFEKACADIPSGATSILLAHSPEVYMRAAGCGFGLMLCGHTHGGQICLPGRIALARNEHNPRYMDAGAWRYDSLQGYTSPGTGASGVPLRFFCPPEVTVHELRGIDD